MGRGYISVLISMGLGWGWGWGEDAWDKRGFILGE